VRPVRLCTVPFDAELATRLQAALPPATPALHAVAQLDADVGAAFGDAVRAAAENRSIDFVASHGITLYHDGDAHISWQIGNAFAIRERTRATVLFDFRRADCAAGGQGAPLVAYVDALFFASPHRFRAAVNLGGIANVTLLRPGAPIHDVMAWDAGPANMVVDAFVRHKTNGRERCDRDGRYALRGQVDDPVLRELMKDPYFARQPPKSTGRERFGEAFLKHHASLLDDLTLENGCATLAALTAEAVARAISCEWSFGGDVIVSGGGVHNGAMMAALAQRLPEFDICGSERFGIDPDFKEALAFVVLGYELLRERAAALPGVTGALHGSVLGAIAPARLRPLLELVGEEVGAAMQQPR
jgi:anhydro-N-acetylmuramic acid kinase